MRDFSISFKRRPTRWRRATAAPITIASWRWSRSSNQTDELVAVGRLVANVDHETAEFAILVADAWQGKGAGVLVTERCLAIAGEWGLRRVEAITAVANTRMIAIFEQCGFAIEYDSPERIFRALKQIRSG